MTIVGAEQSCVCAVAQTLPAVVPPHGAGALRLTLLPGSFAPGVTKSVRSVVYVDGHRPQALTLEVTPFGELPGASPLPVPDPRFTSKD